MFKKAIHNFRLVISYRELLFNLVSRDIAQRYKQSKLGYAWIIINPLFKMLVMSWVFSLVLRVESFGVPYILFLSIALLPWDFFVNSLSASVNSLINNASLITKIYFPREILIYATILAKIVDFAFSMLIFIAFFLFFQQSWSWSLLWLPLIFIFQLLLTIGFSLALSAFNLFYRDIQYLLTWILMLWMYLTPIMYPVEMVPEKYRFILSLNPMAVIVNAYRQVTLAGLPPNVFSLFILSIFSILTFIFGTYIFKKLEGKFADFV